MSTVQLSSISKKLMPYKRCGRVVHILGDSNIATTTTGLPWGEQSVMMSNGMIIKGMNVASGGDLIQDCESNQVPLLIGLPCDELWIQIGSNNYYQTLDVCLLALESLRESIVANLTFEKIRWIGAPPKSVTEDRKTFSFSYNDVLREFAYSNGDMYSYIWADCVDPVDGGILSSCSSGDGVHIASFGHNLAAKRLLSQEQIYSSDIISPIGGSGTLSSKFFFDSADSIMLTDTSGDGVPDIITSVAGTSTTKSLVVHSAPFIGNKFRRTFVDNAEFYMIDMIPEIALPSGDFDILTYFSKSGENKSGITLDFRIEFKNASSVNVEVRDQFYGVSTNNSVFDLEGLYRCRIFKNTLDPTITKFTLRYSTRCDAPPFTSVRDLGMIQVIEL